MPGKSSRTKGNTGERELLSLLSDELGIVPKLTRNLSQTRSGGGDCIDLDGWNIEVKRQEKLNINAWWTQTVEQCEPGKKPILFYRSNRMPWNVMMYLQDINDDLKGDFTCILSFQAACLVIRESM